MKKAVSIIVFTLSLFWVGTALAGDPNNGSKIYGQHCANCHGSNGRASMPGLPDFSVGQSLNKPDTQLAQTIKSGVKIMPGFLGVLQDSDIYDVIAYIRTLQ